MREKASLFEQILNSGGNTLRISLNENLTVRTNAHLLAVILHNLLDNATKNTRDGEIAISGEIAGDRLHLYIQNPDTHAPSAGIPHPGRPTQYITHLEGDGNGLGLILVRDIAALLNIDFTIEAVSGKVTARMVFSEFSGS